MNDYGKDERENDNISVEEVMELASEIAHKQLVEYWKSLYTHDLCATIMEIENEYGEVRYTDFAQDKFNPLYDDVEERIVELMKKHPDKNIIQIKEHLNGRNN